MVYFDFRDIIDYIDFKITLFCRHFFTKKSTKVTTNQSTVNALNLINDIVLCDRSALPASSTRD